jgi:hypothetical protein
MELAPIGVSTYSRINHIKQTIEALQKNTLAKQSELYIFSDAPQKGDEEIVQKVRDYIDTVDGFKKVHVIKRETNGRVANNRGGFQWLLDTYGKAIFLEDDIVTAAGFLQYMNDALEFYKDDDKILTISGYCPTFKFPKEYKDDVFILQRHSSWGMATWGHKLNLFSLDLKNHGFEEFLKDKKAIKEFQKNGEDMLNMVMADYNDELDGLDVKLMYYEYKYSKYSLFPSKSLVQNIGHDGTGLHCGITDKFAHETLWNKVNDFKFPKDIKVDERIRKVNYKFRSMGVKGKLINLTKKVGIYHGLKKIKDKI